jgi:lipopolysaccharide export system permease protein
VKILDRYFIKGLSLTALFSIFLFTTSWLAPEIMFKAIQGIAQHKLSVEQGLAYLLYQVPEILTYCIPISTLFASVFFFRQISLSSELTAILSSGIAFRRLLVPAGIVGLGMSLLFFMTQEFMVPWASQSLRDLNAETRFDTKSNLNPQVTYVEKTPKGTMEKFLVISPKATEKQNQFIFMFYKGEGDSTYISRIVTATHGTWNKAMNVWELQDGIDYRLNPAGIYRHTEAFPHLIVRTSPVPHELLSFPTGNPGEFKIGQLAKYVRLLNHGGQTEDAKFYRVRLYQRFFLPWVPLLFALLGTAIGMERSRAKRNLGLTYAAALLLFYNILVPVSTTLGSIGFLPTYLAALMPLLMAGGAGGVIIKLRKSEG